MASYKDELRATTLQTFTAALHSALPLAHFSQFFIASEFDRLSDEQAHEVLATILDDPKLPIQEGIILMEELRLQVHQIMEERKVKNNENRTQSEQFVKNKIDFLLSDFESSVDFKLVAIPELGLEDLETYLEGRAMVVLGVYDNLSKPGDPDFHLNLKAFLEAQLKGRKTEAIEKQRLFLERKSAEHEQKVLENAKGIILEMARQLQSELETYQGHEPEDLVKEKLKEINHYLMGKGGELREIFPNIYSAILGTTDEVRKCLEDQEYNELTPLEFATSLHQQLLYDFLGENELDEEEDIMSGNSEEMDTVSLCNDDNDDGTPDDRSESHNYDTTENWVIEQNFEDNAIGMGGEDELGLEQKSMKLGDEVSTSAPTTNVAMNSEASYVPEEKTTGDVEVAVQEHFVEVNSNSREEGAFDSVGNGEDEEGVMERNSTEVTSANSSAEQDTNDNEEDVEESVESQVPENNIVTSNAEVSKPSNSERPQSSQLLSRNTRSMNKAFVTKKTPGSGGSDSSPDNAIPRRSKRLKNACNPKSAGVAMEPNEANSIDDNEDIDGSEMNPPCPQRITILKNDPRANYRCRVCTTRFKKRKFFKCHGEFCRKKMCDQCSKGFPTPKALEMHYRTHTGEKPFHCSTCKMRFRTKGNMMKHMRAHARGTSYVCTTCKKKFVSGKSLHDHNLTHKGKLPYLCSYCKGQFPSMTAVKTHVIVHSDVRPFKCPTCETPYFKKVVLVDHIVSIHKESRHTAQRLANDAGVAFLKKEMKSNDYRDIPGHKIGSTVVSYVIQKKGLKLPSLSSRFMK